MIRKIDITELEKLKWISETTFRETFEDSNELEDMAQYLESSFSIERLSTEMKQEGSSFYLAEIEGKSVAYLKVNIGSAQNEFKENGGFEIERLYVLRKFIGQGLGAALFEFSLDLAKIKGHDYVWLGVWENNSRAIRFYEKYGMKVVGDHTFQLGSDLQKDLLMRLDL